MPSANDWDAEGWIAGLPVIGGVGRLVNLRTGEIERDAITRRVSRVAGRATTTTGRAATSSTSGTAALRAAGHWFVKYINDLTAR